MKLISSTIVVIVILFSIQLLVSADMLNQQKYAAPTISAVQIQALQTDEDKSPFVLVDVRSKAETDVSIIPNAITREEFERTQDEHKGEAVIVYCTVGHRSASYAQKLKKSGWNALNYEGSILDWCKNQLPVVTQSGQSTTKVHTYNSNYKVAAGYEAVY